MLAPQSDRGAALEPPEVPRIPLPCPTRTQEVEGSLVVADDHEGSLQLQPLRAPHPHPDAVEVLEGQKRRAQEPARDKGRDKAEGSVWGEDLQPLGWAGLRVLCWTPPQAQGCLDFSHICSP